MQQEIEQEALSCRHPFCTTSGGLGSPSKRLRLVSQPATDMALVHFTQSSPVSLPRQPVGPHADHFPLNEKDKLRLEVLAAHETRLWQTLTYFLKMHTYHRNQMATQDYDLAHKAIVDYTEHQFLQEHLAQNPIFLGILVSHSLPSNLSLPDTLLVRCIHHPD